MASDCHGGSLFGTACRVPSLREESENYRTRTEDHVLAVRLDDDASHGCRFTVERLVADGTNGSLVQSYDPGSTAEDLNLVLWT